MQQVADGVYRLSTSWANFYLVDDAGALTFIDTGFPGYVPIARSSLSELGRSASDVKAIVLTHTHSDHIGGAAALAAESGAPVFVHDIEAGIATGADKPVPPSGLLANAWRPNIWRFLKHAISNGGAKRITVDTVSSYADGDVLDVPGKPRVVFTPGHSAGHSALLLEQRRVLFCGDAMVTYSVRTGATGPMLHPFNEDAVRARESLAILDRLDADVVLPGHGEPFRGSPQQAVLSAASR